MTHIAPIPGLGLFSGWQTSANDLINGPPRPFLVKIPPEVADRSWYAARQGVRPWRGNQLYLDYFVDRETKVVFAQPHHGERPEVRADWQAQNSDDWSFETARELSWWLRLPARVGKRGLSRAKLVGMLPTIWIDYLEGRLGDASLLPLGLPREPDRVYEAEGWQGWADWAWAPTAADRIG